MIEVEGVTKSFNLGIEGHRTVLDNVTFKVPNGCLYGLIGPGAAGKSILLKIITGLLQPNRGSVRVEGDEITSANELRLHELRRKFGFLFQNNALFDHLTVYENVAFPLRRLYSPPEEEVRARVLERMRCVSLPGFEDRFPPQLSGGQKKRVGVARATITQAPFVFYDEPAAGLDPVTSQKIFDLLRSEQRASNATAIMVSSDLDRLLTVTDRVGMLYRGELIFDGTTEEAKTTNEPRMRQFVHGLIHGPL